MKIKLVSCSDISDVIFNPGKYRGQKFLASDKQKYVACDNSTGSAWTEEFDDIADAIAWLEGVGSVDDYAGKCSIVRRKGEN